MKRHKNIGKGLVVLAISLLSFGCNKIADINVNPSNPALSQATPEVLFPSAVMSTTGKVGGDLEILGGIWSQFFAQSSTANQYKNIDSYNLIRTDLNAPYNELFAGALADYQLAISQSKAAQKWEYYLMCTAMKVYTYEVLVDLYDQVPYSQAFLGQDNIQPKFDDGYTVYKGLLAELDDALSKPYATANLSAVQKSTDFVFGGNMSLWTKFANTLELKMYLRMVNAKPAEAQAGVQKLYAAGGNFLTTDAGISSSVFTNTPLKDNPFYEQNIRALNVTTNVRASNTLASWLKFNNDPRATVYFGTSNPTGVNQGDFTATQTAQPTYVNASVFAQHPTDPVWFITAAESYFLQAEAALRYGVASGNASGLYTLGLNAAFAEYSVAPYGTTALTPPVGAAYTYPAAGTFNQRLRAIIVQKWVSLVGGSHSLEAFFDQERTGYPEISTYYSTNAKYQTDATYLTGFLPGTHVGEWVYSNNGVTAGLFPKRLVFPDSERSRNSNTPVEVPITTKVWWGL